MVIVKIGGGESIHLEGIVRGLATLNQPIVVVHGANALRNAVAQRLGIKVQTITSVSGYSSIFSDTELLDVMLMTYAGLRNKRLVELFHLHGRNAIGLTGLDGQLIQGRRNRGIRVQQGSKTMLLRDYSGKPLRVNQELLSWLLQRNYVPVLTVPLVDEQGVAINSENDDIVALLQKTFKAPEVWQFIEAPGILADANNPQSCIERLTIAQLEQMEAEVTGRMKRKVRALRQLFQQGVKKVVVTDGRVSSAVQNALENKGTVIQ